MRRDLENKIDNELKREKEIVKKGIEKVKSIIYNLKLLK